VSSKLALVLDAAAVYIVVTLAKFCFYCMGVPTLFLHFLFITNALFYYKVIHSMQWTEVLIYKTNTCISNAHKNTDFCLLLHVSAELHHLQGVRTQIFKTH
jgi:hypothetical protein